MAEDENQALLDDVNEPDLYGESMIYPWSNPRRLDYSERRCNNQMQCGMSYIVYTSVILGYTLIYLWSSELDWSVDVDENTDSDLGTLMTGLTDNYTGFCLVVFLVPVFGALFGVYSRSISLRLLSQFVVSVSVLRVLLGADFEDILRRHHYGHVDNQCGVMDGHLYPGFCV